MSIRRPALAAAATLAVVFSSAAPAGACAGLVTPGGKVRLQRTATLAAYYKGLEHYVTAFTFTGGGAEVGSIVPLPGIPTKVEKGGEWTLQRLEREARLQETQPGGSEGLKLARTSGDAREISNTRIDALDLTVLEGGAAAIGKWAKQHGFKLTPDAPEVLEFYAQRSKIFLAARFDAKAAKARGEENGVGTPVHLTIPTPNPWVPLRILGLGRTGAENIGADVYLLTTRKPALLPVRAPSISLKHRAPATKSLLDDLRTDKGMGWMPQSMWFTHIVVDGSTRDLRFDLATDVTGAGKPSWRMAGLKDPHAPVVAPPSSAPSPSLLAPPAPAVDTSEAAPDDTRPVDAAPASSRDRSAAPFALAISLAAATAVGVVGARRHVR